MLTFNYSSYDDNKTLLEAILEVRDFLKENPVYKVYYINTAYVIGTATYNLSDIDTSDTVAEGDVIFFNNNYYARVKEVGETTLTIEGATFFKGDTGATGPQGPTGPQGVSVTNATINDNNSLIITLSDGSTINAGVVSDRLNIVQFDISGFSQLALNPITITSNQAISLTSSSHTILVLRDTADHNRKHYFNREEYWLYQQATFTNTYNSSYSPKGVVTVFAKTSIDSLQITFTPVKALNEITASTIDSESASSGKVLTSDGDGTASWQAIPSQSVEGTAVLSTGETSGKVLTADGNGTASWQTASGGTTLNKYTFTTSSSPTTAQKTTLLNILQNAKGINFIYDLSRASGLQYGVVATNNISMNGVSVASTIMRVFKFVLTSGNSVNRYMWSYDGTNWTYSEDTTLDQIRVEYINETEIT